MIRLLCYRRSKVRQRLVDFVGRQVICRLPSVLVRGVSRPPDPKVTSVTTVTIVINNLLERVFARAARLASTTVDWLAASLFAARGSLWPSRLWNQSGKSLLLLCELLVQRRVCHPVCCFVIANGRWLFRTNILCDVARCRRCIRIRSDYFVGRPVMPFCGRGLLWRARAITGAMNLSLIHI